MDLDPTYSLRRCSHGAVGTSILSHNTHYEHSITILLLLLLLLLSHISILSTPRSGHRMIVWRNYLLLFGGFYEALREMRFYNDLYVYSPSEERWTNIPYRSHALAPRPRRFILPCYHIPYHHILFTASHPITIAYHHTLITYPIDRTLSPLDLAGSYYPVITYPIITYCLLPLTLSPSLIITFLDTSYRHISYKP